LRRPAKLLIGCGGAIGALLVAAAIALPLLVDAEVLRRQAEDRLGATLSRKVSLGAAKVSIWTGLALQAESFRIGEPLQDPSAAVPIVEAGRTKVRVAILPLLRKQVEARSIRVEDARIAQGGKPLASDVRLDSSLKLAAGGAMASSGRMTARLDLMPARPKIDARFDVKLAGGTLDVSSFDADLAGARLTASGRVEKLSTPTPEARLDVAVDLGESTISGPLSVTLSSAAPSGRFDLAAPMLDLSELAKFPSQLAGTPPPSVPKGVELQKVKATMTMREGELRLDDAVFAMFGGGGRGAVTAHPFEPSRSFTLEQNVQGVSIGALLAALAPAQKGTVEGTAAVDVSLRGRAGEPKLLPTISGPGRLEIRDGTIKSTGMVQQVMRLLEIAGATGVAKSETPFRSLTADFNVSQGVAATKNLQFRSDDLDLDGGGTVGLGGALKLDVLGSFSKAISGQLVAKTQALSMRVNDQGRLTVPLQIRGTVQSPKVQLDVDKVIREGVTKELKKQGTKKLLDKLFGRS
jgi:uncharacterized protein involved in outer membrane biogenesis